MNEMEVNDNKGNDKKAFEKQTSAEHTVTTSNQTKMKNCPYCGEQILATAKKCRYCGEWLEAKSQENGPQQPQQQHGKQGMQKDAMNFIGLENAALINVIICISCCTTLFGNYNFYIFSAMQSIVLIYVWEQLKMYFKTYGIQTKAFGALTFMEIVTFVISVLGAIIFYTDGDEEETNSIVDEFIITLPVIAYIIYYAYNIYLVGKIFKDNGETQTGTAFLFYSIAWMCVSVCLIVFPSDEVIDTILLLLIYAFNAYMNFMLFRFASSKYEDDGKIQWGSTLLIGAATGMCVAIIIKML